MQPIYDTIGKGYSNYRRPDPRIMALLESQLPGTGTIVNLGAGVGSYEPRDRDLVAVEPSGVMIAQRPRGGPPVVQACAEALPFREQSFDVAMAVLTIHHWSDIELGLREARRVARRRVVLLTWLGFRQQFWLLDYFPEIRELDESIFPTPEEIARVLGPVRALPVPIPHDCADGFLCAYWRRPRRYLDEGVRNAISVFASIRDVDSGLRRLAADLESGQWHERYERYLRAESMDFGYSLIVAGPDVT